MKYPKAWIDAVDDAAECYWRGDGKFRSSELLDRLKEIGALKEIPKAREFWVVKSPDKHPGINFNLHTFTDKESAEGEAEDWEGEVVHVIEVMENE